MGEVVGPQVNKFEEVCSDDHQMSVAGGEGGIQVPCLGGTPYHVTYPMIHVMLPTCPSRGQNDGQTPVKTFLYLLLQAVKIRRHFSRVPTVHLLTDVLAT